MAHVSHISGSIRTHKREQGLERSGLYCKIIQISHSSSFNTLQSTSQGQSPSLQFTA